MPGRPNILSWFDTSCPYAVRAPMLMGSDCPRMPDLDALAAALNDMRATHGVCWLIVNGADEMLYGYVADQLAGGRMSLWHPVGVSVSSDWYVDVFLGLATRGVSLDYVAFDGEAAPDYWRDDAARPLIAADPRYPQACRQWGFPADIKSDPLAFNAAARRLADREFSVIPSALAHWFPEALWSNYNDVPLRQADAALVPDVNGHAAYRDPSYAPCYSPVWYGTADRLVKPFAGTGYAQTIDKPVGRSLTSYERLVWSINGVAAALRADPTARFRAWTTGEAWCGFSAAHRVESRIHALLLGDGMLLHWGGDGRTPEQCVDDDDQLTQACEAYTTLMGDAIAVERILPTIQKDDGYLTATAVRCTDGSVRGRVSWADKAKPGTRYPVYVSKALTVKVMCNAGDGGTSFSVMPNNSKDAKAVAA